MFRETADVIARELSGDRAKECATEIHQTDRVSSFDLYRQTACLQDSVATGRDHGDVLAPFPER